MKLTDEEYQYLLGGPMDPSDYSRVGLDCYEAGFIDDFGMMTQKGTKAAHKYEREKEIVERKQKRE